MSWLDESLDRSVTEPFLARLAAVLASWPAPETGARVTVAFSGGLDSTVLLVALARLRLGAPLRAVHVDHGLHADSAAWSAHCSAVAAEVGVSFLGIRAVVERGAGLGLEAAAREARYAALAQGMTAGEVVLTAHHGDDQLETVLLRTLRGTGVRGLQGIRQRVPFGSGSLARPLLGWTRAELRERALAWGLRWLEDPANRDPRHDRSFLRTEVVPRLVARWPAAARSAQRLTEQMGDAERILEEVAARDAEPLADPRRLPRAVLAALDAPRQRNLLRHLLGRVGFDPLNAAKIDELRTALLDARRDAQPRVRWPGGEGRVYRSHLYLMRSLPDPSPEGYRAGMDARNPWLGPEGDLRFEPAASEPGLPESWLDAGLELRFRTGGEDFRPLDRAHGQPLKRWFQEAAIVPWMRSRIPLLYRGDRLVAVGDLWLADETRAAAREPRWRVSWSNHPPLH